MLLLDLHILCQSQQLQSVMRYLAIQMSNGHVLRVGDKRPRLPSTPKMRQRKTTKNCPNAFLLTFLTQIDPQIEALFSRVPPKGNIDTI